MFVDVIIWAVHVLPTSDQFCLHIPLESHLLYMYLQKDNVCLLDHNILGWAELLKKLTSFPNIFY